MTREEAIEYNEDGKGDFRLIEDSDDFEYKQGYSDGVSKTVVCKCGCTEWIVGRDDYLTVVKCSECGNEFVIHDG